ncbi:MAG: alpha/beta fold hydrolase [Pseudomonadota bacterium]
MQIIDAIYDAALEPDRYLNFTEVWEEKIIAPILDDRDFRLSDGVGTSSLNKHFDRALRIFERTREHKRGSAQAFLGRQNFAAALLHLDGSVIAANPAFHQRFGMNVGDGLFENTEKLTYRLDRSGTNEDNWMSPNVATVAARYFLPDGGHSLIIVEKLTQHQFSDIADDIVLLVKSCHAEWSDKGAEILARSFALTPAEMAVARMLYDGLRANEIARQRERSIGTIKKQLKSLLSKAQLNSQAEFISMSTGLMHVVEIKPDAVATSPKPNVQVGSFSELGIHSFNSSKRIQYAHFGAQDGAPVLYLHGHTSSAISPPFVADAAAAAGLRVVAPCKPGIGESSASAGFDPVGFVADCLVVSEQLGIGQPALVGHAASGVYAVNAAARYPRRFSSVTLLDTGAPLRSEEQFLRMPESSRRIFLAAKSSPELLYAPFAFAAESARRDADAERAFVESQLAESAHDTQLIKQPKFFALARRALLDFMSTPQRSVDELVYWVSDWTDALSQVAAEMPVHFIHSEKHDWLPHADVANVCGHYPSAKLTVVEATAQLLVYERPHEVFDAIAQLA